MWKKMKAARKNPPKKRKLEEEEDDTKEEADQDFFDEGEEAEEEVEEVEELDAEKKQLEEYLKVALDAADTAAALVVEKWAQKKNVQFKGSAVDLVTEVDVQVEKLIVATLQSAFPTHKFLGEEGEKHALTDEPTWVIDPIDGTTNFVHGYPFICICIGLSINKQVQVGVVHNPVLNEKFAAYKGGGAFLNGKRIHVSETEDITHASVSSNIGYGRGAESINFYLSNIRHLLEHKVQAFRASGSAAALMCDVACGRSECYYEWGIQSWDIAAASVIVEEAGGVVISPTLHSSVSSPLDLEARSVLCGNKAIVTRLFGILDRNWHASWD